jgi:hypothetical protein
MLGMVFLCRSIFTEIYIYKDVAMNQMIPMTHQKAPQPRISPLIAAKRSNTAKRLVSTKDMAYQDWLEVRKQGIGSSDAATACGLNPYMSMLELWLIKTGRQTQSIEDELGSCTTILGQATGTLSR